MKTNTAKNTAAKSATKPASKKTISKTTGTKAKRRPAGIPSTAVEAEEIVRKPIMLVTFDVPPRVAALLTRFRGSDYVSIGSASVDELADSITFRARQWEKKHLVSGTWHPARKDDLARMIAEGPSVPVTARIEHYGWRRIQKLARVLGITPGDWLLASAAYNAELNASREAEAA